MLLKIADVVLARTGDGFTFLVEMPASAITPTVQDVAIKGEDVSIPLNRGNAQVEFTITVWRQFPLAQDNLNFNLKHMQTLLSIRGGPLEVVDFENNRITCPYAAFSGGQAVSQLGVGLKYEYKFRTTGEIKYGRF